MTYELQHEADFKLGAVQVSTSRLKEWHDTVLHELSIHPEERASYSIASGNSFVLGLKRGVDIDIYVVNDGYRLYEYEATNKEQKPQECDTREAK